MFRYKKSVPVSYERQGQIYFTSLLYKELSAAQQRAIEEHCRRCGGEYHRALFEFVTTSASATAICLKHSLSRSALERVVRRYYKTFPADL